MGGFIGLLNKNKNIIMSRRSLNNYQKKWKLFPVRKIENFLHKRVKLIIANAVAVKKNLIEEGASKKIKVIFNGFVRPKPTRRNVY